MERIDLAATRSARGLPGRRTTTGCLLGEGRQIEGGLVLVAESPQLGLCNQVLPFSAMLFSDGGQLALANVSPNTHAGHPDYLAGLGGGVRMFFHVISLSSLE